MAGVHAPPEADRRSGLTRCEPEDVEPLPAALRDGGQANPGSVVTTQQVDRVFDVAARHHVTAVVDQFVDPRVIRRAGYAPVRAFRFSHDIPQFSGTYAGATTISAKPGTRLSC